MQVRSRWSLYGRCVRLQALASFVCMAAACDDPDATRAELQEEDAGVLDAARPALDARMPPRDAALPSPRDAEPEAAAPVAEVSETLRVLSYNVAGLPEGISGSAPSRNSALISPLLNGYDLALLQEDFSYHAQIIGAAMHPYRSPLDTRGNSLGDGLHLLSQWPFEDFQRLAWNACFGLFDSGSDCLTPKGFSYARLTVGDGLIIDVYDVHTDAGSTPGDKEARADNFSQLAAAIALRSRDRAVIVAGDLNARYTRAGDTVPALLEDASLRDVWVELIRGGALPEPGPAVECSDVDLDDPQCERIDKILYRSGGGVRLRPRDYKVEGARFVDDAGVQLSDHRPVSVVFAVSAGAN